MAVVPTQMTITPAFAGTKRMTVQGSVAVNERVLVTVLGVITDGVVPPGLTLRLASQCGRIDYGKFPFNEGDAWAVSGTDATCTLLLNTQPLQDYFKWQSADVTCESTVLLGNGVTDNLYGMSRTAIRNWPQNVLDPVAGSAALQAQLDVLTGRIGGHQHDGGEASAAFPHNNLTGRDAAGAHPTIESGVANAALAAANAQAAAEVAGGNASTALDDAQAAKAVTDAIQDGGAFPIITRHMTDTEMKAILNQIIAWLNARRYA